MARSNRSRRESDRAAKARRTTRRGRPNRVRRSPRSLCLKHRAGRPRRQRDEAACTGPLVLGDPSARSLAYLARSLGIQLLRAHATDGATNTMIRETRDTAPPGALLRSRRCAYGCRSCPPCDVLFRSLYFLYGCRLPANGLVFPKTHSLTVGAPNGATRVSKRFPV